MCWCEPQHVAGQIMRFGPPPRVDERLTEVIRRPDPAIKAYSEILVEYCLMKQKLTMSVLMART